jgi:purine-binding chemotaxis protein CheW
MSFAEAAATPQTIRLLVFRIDGHRLALRLKEIDRVIRVVELIPLPGAPHVIRGAFSLHGRILPVADLRRRLGLPDREIELEDRIVVARSPSRVLGLLVAGDTDLADCTDHDITAADSVYSGTTAIDGIARLPDGLVLIHNLEGFLSSGEARQLAEALHDVR